MPVGHDYLIEIRVDDEQIRDHIMQWLWTKEITRWKNRTTMADKYYKRMVVSFSHKDLATEFKMRFG